MEFPKSDSQKAAKHKDEGKPRITTMHKKDPANDIPEADEYVIMCWHECGEAMSGAMGPVPLTWQEIRCYSDDNGLNAWERKMLREMSKVYCSGLSRHKDAFAVPPGWTKDDNMRRIRYLRVLEFEDQKPA